MTSTQLSLKDLFGEDKRFFIPAYQRAYSWDKTQLKQLIEDLKEHATSKNSYFLGNIILMKKAENADHFDIIDGQQRLTAIIIFMRALINVTKLKDGQATNNSKIDIKDIEKKYLIESKTNATILSPVDYDNDFFSEYVIKDQEQGKPQSPSQKRIKESKAFIVKELQKIKQELLADIYDTLRNSQINRVELEGEKESALMFELQNNRGKDLTNMEKLKSYFMYRTHCISKREHTEENIRTISEKFKEIYRMINNVQLEEDLVLLYHNQAYEEISGIGIGDGYDFEIIKSKINTVDDILSYTEKLKITFQNMKHFESWKNENKTKLQQSAQAGRGASGSLFAFVYPFIIKGYQFLNDDTKLSILCKILEIVSFRNSISSTKAKMGPKLNPILKDFNGDLKYLNERFNSFFNEDENRSWYWSDEAVFEWDEGGFGLNDKQIYENCDTELREIVLPRYEKSLQDAKYEGTIKGEIHLEHISPQKPEDETKEKMASGYELNRNGTYTEEFEDQYLNCIGNLMLISESHNCSIGNKPFKEKLQSYKEKPLGQMGEIESLSSKDSKGNCIWDRKAIQRRREKIIEFARQEWSFDSVKFPF